MELRRYQPNDPALVREWQRAIGAEEDGIFGRETEKLTIRWQLSRRLRPDGVVTDTIFGLRGAGILVPKRLDPEEPGASRWPFLQAVHSRVRRKKPCRLIVVHSMEHPQRPDSAEGVAAWFAGKHGPAPVASAHLCADEDSAVRCVLFADQAAAAPGSNEDGYHLEHAGYARQTQGDWLTARNRSMLEITAEQAARVALYAGLPVRELSVAEVRAGEKGFCSHYAVSLAFGRTTHVDPGPGFPWAYYLERVSEWRRVLEISGAPW